MKRLFLLLIPISCFGAAQGDITGAAIESDGCHLDLYISGFTTNTTCNNGLTNRLGGSDGGNFSTNWIKNYSHTAETNPFVGPKCYVWLKSQGYTTAGATTTRARMVYGTHQRRLAYSASGAQSNLDETIAGGILKSRIWLSEPVYSGDSNLTLTVLSGFLANGTTNCNPLSSVTWVTNNSTLAYPKVIANWSFPGFYRQVSNTMILRAIAFDKFFILGDPVACVKFTIQDQHSHTASITNLHMTIDKQRTDTAGISNMGDIYPTGEYVARFNMSGASMTALDQIRCDLQVYPWIGDSTSVLDTTLNTYTQPTPLPASITNLYDPNNSWSKMIAIVDPVNGNDATAKATNCPIDQANAAVSFKTISKAFNAIAASNNTYYSHNDPGAGCVYLRSGSNCWMGAATTYGAGPTKCYAEVRNYPGDSNVYIGGQSGDNRMDLTSGKQWLHFIGVYCTNSAANMPATTTYVWFDSCTISNTGSTALWQLCTNMYFTFNTLPYVSWGLQPPNASLNNPMSIIRGNNFDGFGGKIVGAYMTIGNRHADTNGSAITLADLSGDTTQCPNTEYGIVYNNYFGGLISVSAAHSSFGANLAISNGFALVQNVFEYCTNSMGASPGYNQLFSANGKECTNIIVANNEWLGTKENTLYNDDTTSATWRMNISYYGNVFDSFCIKSDLFTGGASGANANRIGNWPSLNGVGFAYNAFPQTTNVSSSGAFNLEWIGMNSVGINVPIAGTIDGQGSLFLRFQDPKRFDGDASVIFWSGGGNYRLRNISPIVYIMNNYMVPFDLNGISRSSPCPAGAYATAN